MQRLFRNRLSAKDIDAKESPLPRLHYQSRKISYHKQLRHNKWSFVQYGLVCNTLQSPALCAGSVQTRNGRQEQVPSPPVGECHAVVNWGAEPGCDDGVSIEVYAHRTGGLVGESPACGWSYGGASAEVYAARATGRASEHDPVPCKSSRPAPPAALGSRPGRRGAKVGRPPGRAARVRLGHVQRQRREKPRLLYSECHAPRQRLPRHSPRPRCRPRLPDWQIITAPGFWVGYNPPAQRPHLPSSPRGNGKRCCPTPTSNHVVECPPGRQAGSLWKGSFSVPSTSKVTLFPQRKR